MIHKTATDVMVVVLCWAAVWGLCFRAGYLLGDLAFGV